MTVTVDFRSRDDVRRLAEWKDEHDLPVCPSGDCDACEGRGYIARYVAPGIDAFDLCDACKGSGQNASGQAPGAAPGKPAPHCSTED